jgi:hypothetical protein
MNRPEQWDSNTILRRFRARKLAFYDAAIRDGALTILEIRLMWRLIDRLNPQTGDCWPSLETVAAELRCNLRALKRAEKRLEEKGVSDPSGRRPGSFEPLHSQLAESH